MYLQNLIICLMFFLTFARMPHENRQKNGLVGGRNPKPGEIKYIVVVHSDKYICGGGIIGQRHILTAAHCVHVDEKSGKLLQPMKIIAGTNVAFRYNPAHVIEINVTRAFLPSVYYRGTPDDIAVLELKEKLNFVKYHTKIKKLSLPKPILNSTLYPLYEGVQVTFAGYGNTRTNVSRLNGKDKITYSGIGPLKVARAKIVSIPFCKRFFKKGGSQPLCLSVIEDRSGIKPQGTCKGDSGSPAVYNNHVLIGIDSTGLYCNNNRAPTLFTRVSNYVSFINKAMKNDTKGLVVYKS